MSSTNLVHLRPARVALVFGAAHGVVSIAGVLRPSLYGFLLGRAGSGTRVRVMAALDLPPTLAVAHAAATAKPLRNKLRVGAASDVCRAVAVATLFADAPPGGRAVLAAVSLAGAGLAVTLSTRLDCPQDHPTRPSRAY